MTYFKHFLLVLTAASLSLLSHAQCGTTGDTIFVTTTSELEALQSCENILGSIYIDDGDLENLSDLSSLTSVEEHFVIHECISLLTLEGLEQLEFIGGDFKVISNFTLQDITHLNGLQEVGGDIYLESNLGLDNLDGLQGLDSLYGSFGIYDNPTIQSLMGFDNISYVAGDFILREFQNNLTDLTAMSNLLQIDGSLEIYLRGISNLEGFENLANVGNDLRMDSTLLLFNADGLEGLTTIGGSLQVIYNESLFSIEGLSQLESIGGDLLLSGNPGLANCCSMKPLMVAEPPQIDGTITVEQNASGCNSQSEIMECIIDRVEENTDSSGFQILAVGNGIEVIAVNGFRLSIYDLSGRMVHSASKPPGAHQFEIPQSITGGMVFIKLIDEKGNSVVQRVLVK